MKIFVSHQRADASLAASIAVRLKQFHGIETYLDLFDPDASAVGDVLGDYIRNQLGSCTHLLAVVSANTRGSWWVPWEIGIATEKEQPISTYAGGQADLPVYLKKWPYLLSLTDLDQYAAAAKSAQQSYAMKKRTLVEALAKRNSTNEFYRDLRARLRQ